MRIKVIVACSVFLLSALPLFAPIYMKLDTIPGESHDAAHPGWIDIESFSWGATPTASAHTAGGSCSLHDIVITKKMDKASPALAQAALTGQPIPNLTLEVNGERHMLQNVQIKSVRNIGGVGGANASPMQQLELNFARCATHETGAGMLPMKKATQYIKMSSNAFLTLTGRGNGDPVSLQDFHFNGPNQAVLTVRGGDGGTNAILIGLLRASQAHQKLGTLSVKAKKPGTEEYMTWTMSDVLISSYQSGGAGSGFDQVTLNFGHLDGAMAPFHDVYIK
ncbi:MAG TPA: type VI secretion system tube protein Hcp [Thermoanaerobaculia bacterium]|nr:type VI secretion system tube protein Hcp [Thermoanaerobaculia bacterium]